MLKDSILTQECEFHIRNFSVSRKTVHPPEPFICYNNRVLFDRFFHVVQGEIIFNNVMFCPAGSIVYLPYNITYESRWNTSHIGEFISVNFILEDRIKKITPISDHLQMLITDKYEDFLPFFKNMHDVWTAGAFGYKTKSLSLLFELFNRILLYDSRLTARDKVYGTVRYLENNYLSDITCEELAKMSGLKECMFRRNFKKITGTSPIRFKNTLKLKKAYEMLKSGEFSVTETAIITNFNDLSYFNRMFKQEFGLNPSDILPATKILKEQK